MKYISTRGDKKKYTFSEAVLEGIAQDGGLFVPEHLPTINLEEIKYLQNFDYAKTAFYIFKKFDIDFEDEEIKEIIALAYNSQNFDDKEIAPIVKLDDRKYMLELWHGPTAAFKDMALQIMPIFFEKAIEKNCPESKFLILVATSGDTGSAALEGFKNRKNIKVAAFYPKGAISTIQELQMTTIDGENTFTFAVAGNFDDIQKNVKNVFNNKEFNNKLQSESGFRLSSANSINWGRLLPQIVYHIKSYAQMVKQGYISLGEKVDIVVPSANFGNILAAFYAREMGLPVEFLVSGSNDNNVLEEFINSGIYHIDDRELQVTPSPSMDIIVSSNLERMLYEITKDSKKISEWMKELSDKDRYKVDKETKSKMQKIFRGYSTKSKDSIKKIKEIYSKYSYLVDTHTAIGIDSADKFLESKESKNPMIISATASWGKFGESVLKALEPDNNSEMNERETIEYIARKYNVSIQKNIKEIFEKKIAHRKVIKKNISYFNEGILRIVSE
ncbi:MAG TPA: threonine synthase [Candidatus Dojkabacteria bacterium]|jgi:threonine synthase